MKMKRFEHNIRKELIKGSLITIFLMMMLAVILLGVYRVNMRNHRLNNTTQTFAQVVPETLSTIDHSFYQTNTDLIEQYISGTGSIETSQIYRLFYSFNSQQQIKSDLLLFDSKKKLEAQFHPHFLANTLETIRSAMYIDTELANEVLLRMNSLLRYSVDEQNEGTTLSEDLEYVKNYLAINEIRFEDFSYELSVDKKLNNVSVPKLFLLPLIENSLKYGFKHRRDLKVKVAATLKGENVIIRVMDNGDALEDKDREKVIKLLDQTEETSYHHGLKNTKQRIQLVYPNAEFKLFTKMSCTVNEIRIKGVKYV